MQTNRRLAVAAGVAFLIATVASIGVALASPILGAPDYLTQIPANEGRVILGAFFQFMGALACPAIAIALYPVLVVQPGSGPGVRSASGPSRAGSTSSSPSAC